MVGNVIVGQARATLQWTTLGLTCIFLSMPRSAVSLAFLSLLLSCVLPMQVNAQVFSKITDMEPPAGPGAREPSLTALENGQIAMSWTDVHGSGFAIKTAIGGPGGWTRAGTVIDSPELFVNWADFPSIAAFSDGKLAVHWLMNSGDSAYAYDVNIALSEDGGETWGQSLVPHRDRSEAQHGFASLQPMPDGRLIVVWLDGRAYDTNAQGAREDAIENAMQLRATTFGPDGKISEDQTLDIRTCTCCQTSATVADDGTVLVAYRDRTETEIRDISLVRLVDDVWSHPATVHQDGWEISGCPINGPAIDARGGRTVLAWFTAANDIPSVNVAFSDDVGETFSPPARVDRGEGVGRVDALQLVDGSAIVSWVEWMDRGEGLFVCRVWPGRICEEPQMISLNEAPGSINFPRMAQGSAGIYIAWTQPLGDPNADFERDVTIRMVLGEL